MDFPSETLKRYDIRLSYVQVAKRTLFIFGILFLLVLARLSSRVADPTAFYVLCGLFFLLVLLGTYYRYNWYFKESFITIDDRQINWYRNGEDHVFLLQNISGARLPNRLGHYYGLGYFQLRFAPGPNLNLDVLVPFYDEIIAEIVARMKNHPHLQGIVAQIEQEMT